ncbi:hypothetical protein K435DRAFT_867248 [Dendrothele bispora CBS 962.96]|uniref:DUF6532 domain-containing protein n=1 Tax=Dendrothele bispora (strain CBS 962.96) TaxID=1314807 RepID=A0A4S8LF96_DENBC|nr:hypothetical protein K435DRAFT_867248 [Dendrothele bispora CBS 962.96]
MPAKKKATKPQNESLERMPKSSAKTAKRPKATKASAKTASASPTSPKPSVTISVLTTPTSSPLPKTVTGRALPTVLRATTTRSSSTSSPKAAASKSKARPSAPAASKPDGDLGASTGATASIFKVANHRLSTPTETIVSKGKRASQLMAALKHDYQSRKRTSDEVDDTEGSKALTAILIQGLGEEQEKKKKGEEEEERRGGEEEEEEEEEAPKKERESHSLFAAFYVSTYIFIRYFCEGLEKSKKKKKKGEEEEEEEEDAPKKKRESHSLFAAFYVEDHNNDSEHAESSDEEAIKHRGDLDKMSDDAETSEGERESGDSDSEMDVDVDQMVAVEIPQKKGKGKKQQGDEGNLPAKVLKAHFKTLALKRLAKFGKKAIRVATFLRNAFPKDTSECWQILLDAVAEDGNEGHSDAVKALEKSPYDQDLLLRYMSYGAVDARYRFRKATAHIILAHFGLSEPRLVATRSRNRRGKSTVEVIVSWLKTDQMYHHGDIDHETQQLKAETPFMSPLFAKMLQGYLCGPQSSDKPLIVRLQNLGFIPPPMIAHVLTDYCAGHPNSSYFSARNAGPEYRLILKALDRLKKSSPTYHNGVLKAMLKNIGEVGEEDEPGELDYKGLEARAADLFPED